MEYSIREVEDKDLDAVVDIFNYYAKNTYAAYPEEELGRDYAARLRELCRGHAFYVLEAEGTVVGFGMMKPFHPFEVFRRTAELTYFILPEYTRAGLGTRLVETLLGDARRLGKDTILVNISSENEASLKFHERLGFEECGRLRRVGRKFGRDFDVVYMQKYV